MKIAVFLKQVPDNTKVKPEQIGNTIPRDGVPMMMNPYDEYALETALKLKEAGGEDSTITIISAGKASTKEIVKKAIAVGGDDAYLITDAALDNSDSSALAYALAESTKQLADGADVLIFGQQSLDDAAGQTGPKVAELLDLPSLTFCKSAELNGNTLTVTRETEQGLEVHELTLPGVLCMMKCDYELRTANIKGVMKANKTQIPEKTATELSLDTAKIGAAGSPTKLVRVWQRPAKTAGQKIDGSNPKAAADQLIAYLKESKIL